MSFDTDTEHYLTTLSRVLLHQHAKLKGCKQRTWMWINCTVYIIM